MSDRALIVFLKHPEPGAVKTRLVPALGAETAAAVYRVMAEEVLRGRFGEGGTIRIRKGEGTALEFEAAEPVEAPS